MKLTKSKLKKIIKEELYNPQSDDADYKVGIIVKDVNPDCPHHKSMGTVTEVSSNEVTYEVENLCKRFKTGDIVTKTKDQLIPLNSENIKSLSESKIRSMIKVILKEQGVADKDLAAAKKIKNDLKKIGKFIETGYAMIDNSLSSFNSPGLKTWLYQAINKGISRNKFDRRAFEKELEDWFRYRD